MKSLFTILLSFIGCVSLIGQTVPMVVAGDVHISGPVYSKGAVHVYAKTSATVDTGKINIDNSATAVLATDTIILYSNNDSDGLLINTSSTGVKGTATAAPAKVVVRKDITYGDNNKTYTLISLPFFVETVYGPSGQVSNYSAYEMDIVKKADDNLNAWKKLGTTDKLKKATGYAFWSPQLGNVDFVTTNPDSIAELFSNSGTKYANYEVYRTSKWNEVDIENARSGWAYIGGLNTTTFNISNATIDGYNGYNGYNGTAIYAREKTTSLLTAPDGFKEIYVGSGNDVLELAPYVPFYVHHDVSTPREHGVYRYVKFGFKPEGLLHTSALWRSSREGASSIKDQLFFKFSSENNSYDRFYLNFSDDYTESFRASEDAIKLSTSSEDSPRVWLLDETNRLFVYGLPMKEGRAIKIGYSSPEAGDYTISMDALRQEEIRTAILIDNITNEKVDMLQYPSYTFSTDVGVNEGRFILYINGTFTGAPMIEGGPVYAFVKDNILTVKNISEGDRIQVLDLAGRTIRLGHASGKEFSMALSQKGVYVVNVKGGKTSVLKVLNK
jgi:hypothetical protein